MPILDLYEHGGHRKNLAHFATLASLAAIDGNVSSEEKAILDKFAFRLNITDAEYKEIMKADNKYPIETPHSGEKRYKRLHEFFQIIFSDNIIDDQELRMVKKYAIGLGFPAKESDYIIEKSIAIFSGNIDFDDYHAIMTKKD